jgi:hypothetical protein
VSDTDDGSGSAARAFDDLRAEVSVLRRALESLPAAWQANQAPDYTPTLGAISKRLQEVGARLQAIEGHPALRMTPEHHQQAIVQAGSSAMRESANRLDIALQAVRGHATELTALIGAARTQDLQMKWLIVTAATALLVGLLASPMLARLLPFGLDGRVAALAMGTDRWQAGGKLMAAASPAAWRDLELAAELLQPNREALAACRDAAAKIKKEQHCSIVVPVAPGP